jgi:hypothetical protein
MFYNNHVHINSTTSFKIYIIYNIINLKAKIDIYISIYVLNKMEDKNKNEKIKTPEKTLNHLPPCTTFEGKCIL